MFSLREISTFQSVRFRVFITRDFIFAIKADFISVCHEMGDYIPTDEELKVSMDRMPKVD